MWPGKIDARVRVPGRGLAVEKHCPKPHDFQKKKLSMECVLLCHYNLCFKHFSFWEEFNKISKLYVGLHPKYPLFMSNFNQKWNFSTDFKKSSNVNFHENPSCGSRVCPCRWMDGQTDRHMTKLTVAFCNFAIGLNN